MDKIKKFGERLELFLAGHVDMYGQSLVQDCVPSGKYIKLLGAGGQSVAILIDNQLLNRPEVLLICHPDMSQEAMNRFFRAMRTLVKLQDREFYLGFRPPFPKVYQAKLSPPYITQEYIRGNTLLDYIQQQEALSVYDKLVLFKKLGKGLQLLHNHGVVHRDVKPTNIIIDEMGEPWIIDFGLSKSCYDNPLTRSEMALGTPKYMAPEQMLNAATVRPAADIYSFGKVFYFIMLADESFDTTKLPLELVMSIPRALMHEPEARYESVDAFVNDVLDYYPDYNIRDEKAEFSSSGSAIGRQFSDLLILLNGNIGKAKLMLDVSNKEFDDLMQLARQEVMRTQ